MNTAVLSLGSNTGDRHANLDAAILLLKASDILPVKKSGIYATTPWGKTDQPFFFNQVIEAATELGADELMETILGIEKKLGRTRNEKWEPRILDIDILFFNDEIIRSETVTIPHPHLHERRFVLAPLAEILPGKIHPVFGKTVSALISELQDPGTVQKLKMIPG